MLKKLLIVAGLSVLAVSVASSPARADDTLRLGFNGGAGTMTLGLDPNDDADTLAVRRFYRGGHYGGYHGGFARPYYGFGYRSFYAPRFYGAGYGFGFNRPYSFGLGFSYYRPYTAYSYYYAPPVYYAPSFYYSSPYYYCPISDPAPLMPYAVPTGARASYTVLNLSPADYLPATVPNGTYPAPAPNGTYPYDGGPQVPVPMPGANPPANPQSAPRPTVPLEGRAVSLPRSEPKYTYPAYGEGRTEFAQDRAAPVKNAIAGR